VNKRSNLKLEFVVTASPSSCFTQPAIASTANRIDTFFVTGCSIVIVVILVPVIAMTGALALIASGPHFRFEFRSLQIIHWRIPMEIALMRITMDAGAPRICGELPVR
jgi:hypothetical protein